MIKLVLDWVDYIVGKTRSVYYQTLLLISTMIKTPSNIRIQRFKKKNESKPSILNISSVGHTTKQPTIQPTEKKN